MEKSWSGLRKKLEQDYLCEPLRGRIQYFLTHYHHAPDHYGRFCVRVDGKEVLEANPYNESYIFALANELQKARNIPPRKWDGKKMLYTEENRQIEKEAAEIAVNNGQMDIWQVMNAIEIYSHSKIQDSIYSENALVRLFAILDRRVGKRTLRNLAKIGKISTTDSTTSYQFKNQPEWLNFFYAIRLEAEGIIVLS